MTEAIGLRERTRRAVAHELQQVAMGLFLDQGFDSTTIDQIATAAGLSRRSFFRYFAGKDDVLAQTLASTGQQMAGVLAERPRDEAPWLALRQAFGWLVDAMESEPRALALTRMMLESAGLQASHQHKQASWQHALARELETRLPSGEDRALRAQAISGAALACLTTAQTEWVSQDGQRPLAELVDKAMEAVAPCTAHPRGLTTPAKAAPTSGTNDRSSVGSV